MEPVAGVFPLASQRLRELVLAIGDTSVDSVAAVFPRPGHRPGGLVLATVDSEDFHYPLVPEVSPSTSLTHSEPGVGETVPGPHPHAKFHHCDFINVGLQPPKLPKMIILGIYFPQNGIPFKSDFHKISHGGGSLRLHPCAKFYHCSF